jgi:drug/metabolite transporter (DMT)-like permease
MYMHEVNVAVICGLVSALSYGTGDYLSRVAGRAVGPWRASFYYYILGLGLLSIWLLWNSNELHRARGSGVMVWALALATGVAMLAAVLLFTRGLIRGTIGVVAPVTASYGAVTALLSVWMGERFSIYGTLGIALIVAGACLTAAPAGDVAQREKSSGFGWAGGAALAYGFGFWMQGQFLVPSLGPVLTMWIIYATGVLLLAVLHLTAVVSLALPARKSQLMPGLAAGILSIGGFLALTIGFSGGHVALVVVLSSLTSGITVLIARILGQARLGVHQWIAMAMIIVGLALIRE